MNGNVVGKKRGVNEVPSTGKSSNSSSSSRAAAGFCSSFRGVEDVGSDVMALVVGPEPSADADIVGLGSVMGNGWCLVVIEQWVKGYGLLICGRVFGD